MKANEFKLALQRARRVRVVDDEFFQVQGYWWLKLTEKQCKQMYDLIKEQGTPEEQDAKGRRYVSLSNGFRIYHIADV